MVNDKKERDVVKQLALCTLAIIGLFSGYKVVAELIDARREGAARAVLERFFGARQEQGSRYLFGRFAYYDGEGFGSCFEITFLTRSNRTFRYGAAQVRGGQVVQFHRSFEECAIRGAG